MSKLSEMIGRTDPKLTSETWDLNEDETFLHSAYYESGPGEVDVDADWGRVLETPGVVDLAGTLVGLANGAVDREQAAEAIEQAISGPGLEALSEA